MEKKIKAHLEVEFSTHQLRNTHKSCDHLHKERKQGWSTAKQKQNVGVRKSKCNLFTSSG